MARLGLATRETVYELATPRWRRQAFLPTNANQLISLFVSRKKGTDEQFVNKQIATRALSTDIEADRKQGC